MSRKLVAGVVLSAATALTLTGCSEDSPKPPPMSEDSSSPAESESPKQETPEEFVMRFAEIRDEFVSSGDPTEWDKVVSAKCSDCAAFRDDVVRLYEAGGKISDKGWKVTEVHNPYGPNDRKNVKFDVSTQDQIVIQDGKKTNYPGGDNGWLLVLHRNAGSWLVDVFQRRSEG